MCSRKRFLFPTQKNEFSTESYGEGRNLFKHIKTYTLFICEGGGENLKNARSINYKLETKKLCINLG